MRFYVKNETAQEGPFDLVMMVRKIRNGAVTAEMLVLEEKDASAVPAGQHPHLLGFFREIELEGLRGESAESTAVLSFGGALKRGVKFLLSNQMSAVYGAGVLGVTLVLFVLLKTILPNIMAPLSLLLSWIFLQFALGVLLFVFLRLHRGQICTPSSILPYLRRHLVGMLFCASLVAIFSAIGTLFLLVPGIVVLALYSFAPLLVIERGYDFWDAMESSRKTILAKGRPLFEVTFGFAVFNVLAAGLYGLPLAIALPITYGALAEIFDETEFQ